MAAWRRAGTEFVSPFLNVIGGLEILPKKFNAEVGVNQLRGPAASAGPIPESWAGIPHGCGQ